MQIRGEENLRICFFFSRLEVVIYLTVILLFN